MVVSPSVCQSVCLSKLNYEGVSHRYASGGTEVKVICQGHSQISRLQFLKKKAVAGH